MIFAKHRVRIPSILSILLLAGAWPGPDHAAAQELVLAPANAQLRQQFSMITSVRELQDGRLILVDRLERRLAVVDWRAGTVASIGREGRGPGE